MEFILASYLFIFGLMFGSFFNVVGLRVPVGESIIFPRSHCPSCKHTLRPLELVPFFSFLFLKGKCKNCGNHISFIYPFVEVTTAVLFMMSALFVGWTLELLISLTLMSLLMIILVSDIHYMIIPDKVLLFFGLPLFIMRLFIPNEVWWNAIVGGIVGFSLLFFIAIISRGGMGGGDIKLFAVLGIVLGWKGVLLAFFLSTFFGAIFGVIGLAIGKVQRGKPIPFGPFIVLGTIITYFFENDIVKLYITWIVG